MKGRDCEIGPSTSGPSAALDTEKLASVTPCKKKMSLEAKNSGKKRKNKPKKKDYSRDPRRCPVCNGAFPSPDEVKTHLSESNGYAHKKYRLKNPDHGRGMGPEANQQPANKKAKVA